MIKKPILRTVVSAVLLLTLVVLTGCGGKSKKALLDNVPADAEMVMLLDVQRVLDQLELKKDGDSYSYCKELKQVIDASGVSRKDVKKVFEAIDQTEKTVVVFTANDNLWITFRVKSEEDFMKYLKEIDDDVDFDDEDDFEVYENIAVKDNQVWIGAPINGYDFKLDLKELKRLGDLPGDKKFTDKFGKIADALCADDVVSGAYYSIDGLLSIAMQSGELNQQERAAMSVAMSMAFDDAECVLSVGRLNNDGFEGEARVLNSKQENAKFLLPMDKIDAGSLSKIDNNSPLVMATAISPELVKKLVGLVRQHVGLSSSDEEGVNILESLAGTSAFSFAGPEDFIATVCFKNNEAATSFGTMLTSLRCPYPVSAAGNYMILRSKDGLQGGGSAPQGFAGQYFAASIDFSKVSDKILTGYNMSNLGKILITVGPEGQGVVMKSVWKIKNPMRTLLDEGYKFFMAMMSGNIKTAFDKGSSAYDVEYDDYEMPVEELEYYEAVADTVAVY